MSTHTPGPWALNTQDNGLNDSGTILGAGIVIVPDIYGRSKAEADSNAALIKAAPDLLKALRAARAALYNVPEVGKRYDQQHSATHAQACLDIDAVIARAERTEPAP